MNMITIKCPKCGGEAKLSLAEGEYSGPRRCWKCHEYFTITIYNNQVTSCEPLSQEDYERQQEAKKAAEKMGGGINFSQRTEPEPRNETESTRPAQLEFPMSADDEPKTSKDTSKEEKIDIFNILAGKSGGGIDFSKQSKPETPKAPEHKQEFIRPAPFEVPPARVEPGTTAPKAPASRIEPAKPAPKTNTNQTEPGKTPEKPAGKLEPGPIRYFVPFEEVKEEPPKKKKEGPPPDKFNLFIPPAE